MTWRRSAPAAAASSRISAMNTAQCWPSATQPSASIACARARRAEAAEPPPRSSMKEPVPALHASFMAASTTRPPSSRMYFAS